MTERSFYNSPLGRILLEAEGDAITGLWFCGQKYYPGDSAEFSAEESPALDAAAAWLDRYFAGERPDISELQLAPKGSDFALRVWDILCSIPYGRTISYGQIAKQLEAELGRPMSAQAVGGAVGRNPISIIIPCHRVLGAKGSLTGYAAGLETKTGLLRHEGII